MAWGRLPGTTRKSHNYYQRTAPAIPALASPWDKFDLALVFMMGEFLSLGGTNCHSKIRDQLFHASKSKTTTLCKNLEQLLTTLGFWRILGF